MKRSILVLTIYAVLGVFSAPLHAQTLVVTGDTTITSEAVFTSVIVTSTGRLVADALITVSGDMTIESGGVVTHSVRKLEGLALHITGTLDIQSDGRIDVSAKGLLGGNNGSAFGADGETYSEGGEIIAGAGGGYTWAAGASHGGQGANSPQGIANGLPYGYLENPQQVGSGGGGATDAPGGNGGGLIVINAGSCIVDGLIAANGSNGILNNGVSGGGAGGSIRITAGTVSGTGIIQANGGSGLYIREGGYTGSGGGGRVALFFDALTLSPLNIQVSGGSAGNYASAGTVYFKNNTQPYGDLVIDNGNVAADLATPLRTLLTNFQNLSIKQNAIVDFRPESVSSLAVQEHVILSGSSHLSLQNGFAMSVLNGTEFDIDIESGAILSLFTGAILNVDRIRINGGILNTHLDMSFPDPQDFEVSGAGTLNILENSTFSIGSFDPANIQSGTVFIAEGSQLNIASGEAIIGSDVTLIKDGLFGVSNTINSLVIQSGGTLTHSARQLSGLILNVSGTLDLQSGGKIDLTAKGLLGGKNGSIFGMDGECFDETDLIVAGAKGDQWLGAGASNGGQGASSSGAQTSNAPYGLLENPRHLGSGGGSADNPGGNGGGLALITAANFTLNGSLVANGGNGAQLGYVLSGAGSGGGLKLTVANLSGSGLIQANGGNGCVLYESRSGSGGGGRIAIYYDTMSFPLENIQAYGGSVGNNGSSGTIYSKDNAHSTGDIYISNNGVNSSETTPILTTLADFKNLFLQKLAKVNLLKSLNIELQVRLTGASQLTVNEGILLSIANSTGFDYEVEEQSILTFSPGSTFNADRIRINNAALITHIDLGFPDTGDLELSDLGNITVNNNVKLSVGAFEPGNIQSGAVFITEGSQLNITSGEAIIGSDVTLIKDGSFGVSNTINSLVIQSGGTLTHSARLLSGLILNVSGTLDLQSGGKIDLTAKGLLGGKNGSVFGMDGESFDEADLIVAGAKGDQWLGAGASNGGQGASSSGAQTSNAPYGLLENPRHLGSGGGSADNPGGNGGGLALITAANFTLNGSLVANGGNGAQLGYVLSGAGSGGGLKLTVANLSGSGLIQANGGNGCVLYESRSGSGGGGRIAIYYDTMSFPLENIQAYGGSIGNSASSGTIYLKRSSDSYGDLIIDSGGRTSPPYTSLKSLLTTFRNLSFQNSANVQIIASDAAQLTVENQVVVSNHANVIFGTGVTLNITHTTGSDLEIISASNVTFEESFILNADSIRINAQLNVPDGYIFSKGTLSLEDGRLVSPSNIILQGCTLLGTGTIDADLVNSTGVGTLDQIGKLIVSGDYRQTTTGVLYSKIGGTNPGQSYSQLIINGIAEFGGELVISTIDSFDVQLGDEFDLVTFSSQTGKFTNIYGWGDFGYLYLTHVFKLVAGYNYSQYSFSDQYLILSPSGLPGFKVSLRDNNNSPVIGSNNAWLDFSEAVGIVPCDCEIQWPRVIATGLSNANGEIFFFPKAGGHTSGVVKVMSSHGVISEISLKSLDVNGGLVVNSLDFNANNPNNDYNNDGYVDSWDWDFFSYYTGHTCLDKPSNYTNVDIYTEPGVEAIFSGETINICAKVFNSSYEIIVLDSVSFSSAGFGIARSWQKFAGYNNLQIAPRESILLKAPFTVPVSDHGCFQVHIYPQFLSLQKKLGKAVSMDADSLVYGIKKQGQQYWAFLASSAGYDFISVPFDSVTEKEDFSSLRLLDLTIEDMNRLRSLPNLELIQMLQTPAADKAALLWYDGLQDFMGTAKQDTILLKLSILFDYLKFMGRVDTTRNVASGIGRSNRANGLIPLSGETNGCGANSGLLAEIPVPDFDFTECCNIHDRCYSNPGCTGDNKTRLYCDMLLHDCIMNNSKIDYVNRARIAVVFFYFVAAFGGFAYDFCEPPPPPDKIVQLNISPIIKSTSLARMSSSNESIPKYQKDAGAAQDSISFSIPIGESFGDTLTYTTSAFLPSGWSFSAHPFSFLLPPDTLRITIMHNFLTCSDTGRIVISALTPSGENAGSAEIRLFLIKGDFNNSGRVDSTDKALYYSWLFDSGQPPDIFESADLNNDMEIDIADLARFIDHYHVSFKPFECIYDSNFVKPEINLTSFYDNDTTLILLDSKIVLSGLQVDLESNTNRAPVNLLNTNVELVHGFAKNTIKIGLIDPRGHSSIPAGNQAIIKIPGKCSIKSATASDLYYHSIAITSISSSLKYSYNFSNGGWQLISLPVAPEPALVDSLFPSAIQNSAFIYNGSLYDKINTLQVSYGYWIAIPNSINGAFKGTPVNSYNRIFTQPGWYMIGSVGDTIDISNLHDKPDDSIILPAYAYNSMIEDYTMANTLIPGQGYWIAVAQACTLSVSGYLNKKGDQMTGIDATDFYRQYGKNPPAPPESDWRKPQIPNAFKLGQSYPNPFNPSTAIEYSLPKKCNVQLTIYNIFGQIVAKLVNTNQNAGDYLVVWNGTNDAGIHMASGVYIYCIHAGSFVESHKMLLLK